MATNADRYPLLSGIESPADLRAMPESDLPAVCEEIRRFLIDHLSVNPGHFASSMGAVELTVALHYVFDTPYDRIVWDVGHQAYGHKILTGRRDRFVDNRKFGGLSGFPNPDESIYDTFMAGHASNSISAALGMAVATTLQGETPRRNIVAVIGDASISGGLAFEGINNAANTPNNMLVILNDNDMSIDDNVGSLNSYLAHLTTSRPYNRIRYRLYRLLRRLHLISEGKKDRILRFNNSLKALLTKQHNIFEGLNIRYFGPFDGHDIHTIVRVLRDIRDMDGPRLLHLRTIKGKGYAPAESNPTPWHAPGRFDPATGAREAEKKKDTPSPMKYQDVFGHTLLELARKDPKIVAITAAMASGTSISTMQRVFPDRVFDVGISEGHALTFAGGLAKEGMRPVVGIYSSFLQRAYDNLIHDIAILRLPVTLCIDRAGLVGEDGVTHHGIFDLSYLRAVPNLIVAAPSDAETLRALMYAAIGSTPVGPFAIRYPRGSSDITALPCDTPEPLPIGRGRQLRFGADASIVTIGTIASEADAAIRSLHSAGIEAAHFDMIFLKPLDTALLDRAAASGAPVITVEDGTVNGGLGSAVAEYFAEKGYTNPLVCLGIPDRYVTQGSIAQLRRLCGIDADSIAVAVREAVLKSKEK